MSLVEFRKDVALSLCKIGKPTTPERSTPLVEGNALVKKRKSEATEEQAQVRVSDMMDFVIGQLQRKN